MFRALFVRVNNDDLFLAFSKRATVGKESDSVQDRFGKQFILRGGLMKLSILKLIL